MNPSSKNDELDKKLAAIQREGIRDEYQLRAQKLKLPYSDLSTIPIEPNTLLLVPEEIARAARMVVIFKKAAALTIAVNDPENPDTKKEVTKLIERGFACSLVMTSPQSLDRILEHYAALKGADRFAVGSLDVDEKDLNALQAQINSISDLQHSIANISATKLLEILLAGALKTSASDIHFEPTSDNTRLRYRLDGVLQDITTIDIPSYSKALNRIKVLGRLKLNIHDAPQDGRFTIREGSVDIEVRVSLLPSEFGETIVMRLLDPRTIKASLEDLGMRPDLLTIIKQQLDKPTGAILTTGPTGSGKTTTLYAFVNYLNSPGSKVITIEDPIEYHIRGISQTQVEPDKGYSFVNGLRAIVRQDPDIILVGEIRDAETAEIALHAALTGHLVLSTIHTNDAAGTIPRLIDLDINPQIIAPAIRIAMAQRLLRTLCPDCKKKRSMKPDELQSIKQALSSLTKNLVIPTLTAETQIYDAGGCDACNHTGYKGRVGVFEVMVISSEMEKLILSSPAISMITELAISQGMTTMHQDAYLKLLTGVTTLDEIARILG